MYDLIKEKINSAQKVLVGLGENAGCSIDDLNSLAEILDGKDYYFISLSKGTDEENSKIDRARLAMPMRDEESQNFDNYLKWLSMTLNKELLIIEIGFSFANPTVIRFPFEKTCYYNKKAYMVRVNDKYAQIPEEISEKAMSVDASGTDFIRSLL